MHTHRRRLSRLHMDMVIHKLSSHKTNNMTIADSACPALYPPLHTPNVLTTTNHIVLQRMPKPIGVSVLDGLDIVGVCQTMFLGLVVLVRRPLWRDPATFRTLYIHLLGADDCLSLSVPLE